MTPITLDQFAVFVAVVDAGSFAAAARRMNRAQSAITYAIQKLEEQSQVLLFDRSSYRPTLTEVGRALVPRARRVLNDVGDYTLSARGFAEGLEAKVSLVADAFVPMAMIVDTLKLFHATFPMAQVRVSIESFNAVIEALREGWADLAVTPEYFPAISAFERNVCGGLTLVPVAAPGHPLALLPTPIEPASLLDHVQLVLSTRATVREGQAFGIHAVNLWHLTDLETKHAMLLAGLGWGSMPRDRVAADLAAGRLVKLDLTRWEGIDHMPNLPLVVAYRKDKAMGPAGRWLVKSFTEADNREACDQSIRGVTAGYLRDKPRPTECTG